MTLAETLISLALTLVVTSTAMALVTPASRASMVQPEAMDVQQRARVAADVVTRDLAFAGAGIYSGPQSGVLPISMPAVLPRRLGVTGDEPDTARAEAITIIAVPATGAQTTLAEPVSPSSQVLSVNAAPNCGGAPLCGFTAGKDVLLSDEAGHFDVFRITSVAGATAGLRLHGQTQGFTYPAGTAVTEVVARTYYLDAASRVLRQYDGDLSDQPAVDHISSLAFEYFGDGLTPLDPIDRASFADGPWIGAGSSRFDADLLRVRMVRVTVRAEASTPALRGVAPDVQLTVDVAPRSLVLR